MVETTSPRLDSVAGNRGAVFLDRDGTINEQMGYINHLSRFHLLPGVGRAIHALNNLAVPVVVVTNQSGLARGYFPDELLDDVHARMNELLALDKAHLDGVYVCPHHPEAVVEKYRQSCDCRKPKPGLLRQAARDLDISLEQSFMVGDRWSDIRCAAQAGCSSILVLTGYGRGDLEHIGPGQEIQPDYIAEDLTAAAEWIRKRIEELRTGGF